MIKVLFESLFRQPEKNSVTYATLFYSRFRAKADKAVSRRQYKTIRQGELTLYDFGMNRLYFKHIKQAITRLVSCDNLPLRHEWRLLPKPSSGFSQAAVPILRRFRCF